MIKITKEDLEKGIKIRKKEIDNFQNFLITRTTQEKKHYPNIMKMVKEKVAHNLYMVGVCKRKLEKL